MKTRRTELKRNQWRNRIDPVDLFVLEKLSQGEDPSSKAVLGELNDRFGISLTRRDIEARIERLQTEEVVLRRKTVLVDPTKLYDYVFLIFIKLHLPSMVSRATTTWDTATQTILEINERYNSPVKILFTILGWGEYDLAGIVYVDDQDEYYRFQKELTQQGFIEKYDTKTVHQGVRFYFEPVSIPDVEQSREQLEEYRVVLSKLTEYMSEKA